MESNFQELPDYIDALIAKMEPAQRKELTRKIAKSLRASQAKRIRQQKAPDDSAFEKRKPQKAKREIKFIYQTGDEVRHLRSWRETKHYIIGFDRYRGNIRTFKKSRIIRTLFVNRGETTALLDRNRGDIRRRMFTGLIKSRWLKSKGDASEASVGFQGVASRVARVHHYGLKDKVNERGGEVDYPERQLLGITREELELIEEMTIAHLARGM
ncbi:phage virion morphogenesis protein [Oceanisphaera sp. KMM 10153]|uniref:phage virion morphogenesis protein n=1 Tax=Oceanisphaera submarina TaxID=3390193 RepID=UPI0039766082